MYEPPAWYGASLWAELSNIKMWLFSFLLFLPLLSAGIGRTGTVIATDIGMQQLERDRHVDILNTFAMLREDRGGMVQTKDQYKFVYQVMFCEAAMTWQYWLMSMWDVS